ncbi:MAG: 50S ribosomal protein L28 [Candidatus Levybacteria bacterium RBG_16_35_11]|nr:MAG: 50S ribosomal protein L28 [Candidatus Levybacteria bacterium RBG_16_35_11]
MALRCVNCGKGIMYGHNVSHSKRRTRRIFKPNLHRARITINGTTKKVKLCTKCLRMVRLERKASKQTDQLGESQVAATS